MRGDRPRSVVAAIVAALLVVGVGVGVDRVAAWVTARGVERAISLRGHAVSEPQVDIHGFPFLTQLAAGRLRHVTGTLDAGTFGGYEVSDVHLDATGVEPRSPWNIEEARIDGLVTFTTVEGLVAEQLGRDVHLAPAPDEPGGLAVTTQVLGLEVGGVVVPDVVDASTVGVQVRALTIGGARVDASALPGGLGERLGAVKIQVHLPEGLSLREVGVEPGGLRLGAEGRDVDLEQLTQ
ncbi:DUF2993 domain-containing protein [Xylanimonas sp. McL0601]|uniref:LmeA family phospholipid-binding protein n=1 Tax=Xylanimonas sp. McL0601 TaxID=3414739 RepID=UPI003CEDA81E